MPDCLEWDIGIAVLSVYDEDGFLAVQPDAEGEQQAGVKPFEQHAPYGLYARGFDPVVDDYGNPDPSQAHQLLYAVEGGKGHALLLQNPAVIGLLPTLQPGEVLFYGPKGQFIRHRKDGSSTWWCPANADGDPDAALSFGPDGFSVSGRWGKLEINDNRATIQHVSGARIDLGAMGGLPGPVSALSSSVTVSGGAFDAQTTAVSLGVDGGAPAVPLPDGQFLMSWMTSVIVALEAIAACLVTASQLPTSGITQAQYAAYQAAAALVLPPAPPLLWTNANATK